MLDNFDIWKLLAGLGIFIFGMFLMEESIKKLSGRTFKKLIREYTTGKIKAITSGAFVTSILQSSSAVSLMTLAFVGAGLMTMQNAIGVILGSNIGTTATAWIVATIGFKVNIESFALPLIGFGGLGIIFLGKSEKYSNISKLFVGFGFLFMGLDYMKTSVELFAKSFDINSVPEYGLLLYLLAGIALTALMQSSSATMAIILTTLNAEIITFNIAAAMVIGANVGTTVTILLGSIGAVQIKKRVAYSHFVFNVVTGLVAFIMMPLLTYIVLAIFDAKENAVMGLALFHTFFNVLGVLLFFPFIHLLAKLMYRVFPDIKRELTNYINKTTSEIPEAATTALKNETLHLIRSVLLFNVNLLNIDYRLIFSNWGEPDRKIINSKISNEELYENLKLLQAEIFTYAASVQEKELTPEEASHINGYLHGARMALHAAKTFKDIKTDIDDFENADNEFLNNQFIIFRKRLIETYLKIDKLLKDDLKKDKVKYILKILKIIKEEDAYFISNTSSAAKQKQLENLSVSSALIVNRAFVQSSRQILLATRELVLTQEEISNFEKVQELTEIVNQ